MSTTAKKKGGSPTAGRAPERTTLSRKTGLATGQRYQCNGKVTSREVAPPKWVAGSPTPEYGGPARTLDKVRSSQEGLNRFPSSQSVTFSLRSVPGLVLGFPARVARRGSVGVDEHLDRTKGLEGG